MLRLSDHEADGEAVIFGVGVWKTVRVTRCDNVSVREGVTSLVAPVREPERDPDNVFETVTSDDSVFVCLDVTVPVSDSEAVMLSDTDRVAVHSCVK